MKIEKLNENQIRCTLTHADLAERHLKLSELAYGTEKAKSLFRDMMQQASFDFGFEAEDIPLMIEAIPASADSIVLIITKVEDPEELDTRFSRFTQGADSETSPAERLAKLEGAEEFLDLLNKVKEAAADTSLLTDDEEEDSDDDLEEKYNIRIFSFTSIDLVIQAAHLLQPIYDGANTLYLDQDNDVYLLAISQSEHTHKEFVKICNMLSEYGTSEKDSITILAFLEEHCHIISAPRAVQTLAQI